MASHLTSLSPSLSNSSMTQVPSSTRNRFNTARFPDHHSVTFAPSPPLTVHAYPGSGTPDDPFLVDWDQFDPECPYNWSKARKWLITAQLALCTWTVSFSSSSYSGGLASTMEELHISEELAVLGVSLYVVGFGFGPLVFAPLSEMFGRRAVFLCTLLPYTILHLGNAIGHNLPTLLICRLLSGTFGSSPLTNSGGVISDIWNTRERGLAAGIYATAPFLGPITGPIVGGYVAENPKLGWHFNFWLMFTFSAFTLIFGYVVTPETYTPVLLRRRARHLTRQYNNAHCFKSVYDLNRSNSVPQIMRTNLSRPFLFLFTEPIVTLLALYVAIVYGTLYALFSAFPIIFQQHHGFSAGQGGLAFLGVGLGVMLGTATTPLQNRFYWRAMDRSETGRAPPEARLHTSVMGGTLLPIALFWFAWTTPAPILPIVPILAGVPFGIGVAQILQGLTAYLMDAYSIFFASAIAATIVLRSVCGAIFPLISPAMFAKLGDEKAMSVFAGMAAGCMPLPVLFWKYGWWVRSKSKYAYKDPPVGIQSATSSRPETVTEKGDEEKACGD